jgi:type VI secretion system protein ImpG
MMAPGDNLLRHYLDELSYLRETGERFAHAYPKVAARLELQPDECPDPHVERLIESFAFLTARIQSDLDGDFPEVAAELLNVLYPHYLQPVPSMAVARFEVDPERGKLTTGYEVPRHTRLFAQSGEGAVCRLRTCYPLTLWPIEVTEAELEPADSYEFLRDIDAAAVLRLRLVSQADPFEVLELDRLRFYLHGDPVQVHRLYELLFDSARRVAVVSPGGAAPFYLPGGPDALQAVGFGDDEEAIPYPRWSHPAYRLVQEYFSFPDKFHFADVCGLRGRASGQAVDLLFLLDRLPSWKPTLTPETFALGCTPVVNLFRRTSEPLRIDHRHLEHRLIPDLRREKTTEVHSILSVSGSSDPADGARDYAPFYSFTHDMARRGQRAFWHSRRVPSRPEVGGTDVMLSFRDLDFQPTRPADEAVYAHLLCTNRGLAGELPAGGLLQTDEALPVRRVVCLKKPSRPVDPPLGGQALWRLVSHLSLNHLSLDAGDESLKALHEILGLYSISDAPSQRQQIEGIREMSRRDVVRRLGGTSWKGFCRGTEVTLTFDEARYVGSSAFLLSAVLSRFLALQASTNSFTQLVTRRFGREGEWKRWPLSAGAKKVL